jgi:hypothetical protein
MLKWRNRDFRSKGAFIIKIVPIGLDFTKRFCRDSDGWTSLIEIIRIAYITSE